MKLSKLVLFLFFIITDLVSEIAKNDVVVLVSSCLSIAAIIALMVLEICDIRKIKKAKKEGKEQ